VSYLDRDPYGMYKSSADETSAGPGPSLMGADSLMGEDVMNNHDEDLGDIKEIMLDMQSGKIAYAVLSFGGVLGMGAKLFAVPWNALKLDTAQRCFRLDIERARLESAPGFDKDAWPSMADQTWGREVHSFYNTRPYWES
jgi:sporulation protein YlmC with PRC-barrel domain